MREDFYEKVSTSIQNKCSLLLLIFRIWSFSADAYRPKLLAIFFPDW
ncbi:immunity protein BlpY [Streptococcus pneumoniae GA19101]|nr:immunity protein BlpY [Streptococcus pneumoniae GA19101]